MLGMCDDYGNEAQLAHTGWFYFILKENLKLLHK